MLGALDPAVDPVYLHPWSKQFSSVDAWLPYLFSFEGSNLVMKYHVGFLSRRMPFRMINGSVSRGRTREKAGRLVPEQFIWVGRRLSPADVLINSRERSLDGVGCLYAIFRFSRIELRRAIDGIHKGFHHS